MAEWIFTEEAVIAAARARTGLEDFGGDEFREGLRVLLETYATTAGLSERGRKLNWERVVELLATRLRVQAAHLRHPEIRKRGIAKPMFLTGLPRSGTSALFNLLAEDPAARPLRLWEGLHPDPIEGLAAGAPDPRREALRQRYARAREKNADFDKIHFADADLPEECVFLLASSFCHVHNGVEVLMEPYQSWFQQQDLRPAHRYYADLLRMLDWQRPGERWLLKTPAHLWALDVLAELFPDGSILITHRNPLAAIASYCSMMEAVFAMRGCAQPPQLGRAVLEYVARSLERGMQARERSDPARFLDVYYDDFVADPMATVRRIYGHFALALTTQAEAAMQRHVAAHPRGQHGVHRYDLERYGLDAAQVRERFAAYLERTRLACD